jgi:hypothetical protein
MKSQALLVEAEAAFRESLSLARHQGALHWELRTAASLGRLLRTLGRRREAAELLAPFRDRFEDVLETDDPCDARLLVPNDQLP